MGLHKNAILDDIHKPYSFEYADETARLAATGFVTADIGKLARQISPESLWTLTSITPTWNTVSGDGTLNTDQKAGIDNADSPSAVNPFITASELGYENHITVAKTGGQFNTIQGAIDFAVTEYPDRSYNDQVIITVFSGEYREQIHSYQHIIIQSSAAAYDPIHGQSKAAIINVGDTPGNYIFRTDPGDVYYMVGMSFVLDVQDNVMGRLPEGTFKNCSSWNGHFIENPENTNTQLKDCKFGNNTYGGFNIVGAVSTSISSISMDNCLMFGKPTFKSTHPNSSHYGFISTRWSEVKGYLDIGGDWGIQCFQFRTSDGAVPNRNNFDTTSEVKFQGGHMVNGMHFMSTPSDLFLSNVSFESVEDNQIPDGETDVTSDVHIIGKIQGNIMHNGFPSEIHMDNPDKFVGIGQLDGYISLKAALDSITDSSVTKRYTIQISAGIYTEDNPLQGKEYVSTKAIGDYQTTRIVAANPNSNLFLMTNYFSLEGMALHGVDVGAAVYMGVSGLSTISRCAIMECQRGVHVNHVEAYMQIDDMPLLTLDPLFTIEDAIYVESGHVNIDKVFPLLDSSITTILNVIGTSGSTPLSVHVSAINIFSDSNNITNGIIVDNGAYLTAKNCHFDRIISVGVKVQGNDTFVQLSNTEINNAIGDALYLPNDGTNVQLSLQSVSTKNISGLDLNIVNESCVVYGSAEMSLNNTYINNLADVYATIVDLEEDAEGFNILGELHVGTPEHPTESVFGEGDSYTRGLTVYTFNGAIYTDISTSVKSPSNSAFTFPNLNVGSAIYLASDLQVNSSGDYHKFFGIKMSVITSQIGGEIIAEYYNGTSWVEFNHMTAQSSGKYYRKADKLFTVDPGGYQVRFNPDMDIDWVKNNDPAFNGHDRYWIRFRITSSPSTLPVFEQFKLHSNRHEINADGFEEDMGTARPIIGISVPWSTFQDAATKLGNQDLYLSDNSYAGMAKNRFNANGQTIGTIITMPPWVDTSGDLRLVVSLLPNSSGTMQMSAILNSSIDGDDIYKATPGNTLGEIVSTVSKTVISGQQITYTFLMHIHDKGVQGDGITPDNLWINLVADSIPGDVYGMTFDIGFLSWRRGSHI